MNCGVERLLSSRCCVCKRSVQRCSIASALMLQTNSCGAHPPEVTPGPAGLLLCAAFEHESEPDKYRCKKTLELPL